MAINIENVRDSLYRQTSLSDKTIQYENSCPSQSNPKEICHRIGGKLQIVIKWDYLYDHDRLGGADVSIEGPRFSVLSRIDWSMTDRVSPHKLVLAAKRLMNELASNLTDMAKRPKKE